MLPRCSLMLPLCSLSATSSSRTRRRFLASLSETLLTAGKGLEGGLCALLRPYGESMHGKVIVREIIRGIKGWKEFGVRFIYSSTLHQSSPSSGRWDSNPKSPSSPFLSNPRVSLDPSQSVEPSIKQYQHSAHTKSEQSSTQQDAQRDVDDILGREPVLTYQHYLCKILSSSPMVPYETFAHPVACIIYVSSYNAAPIDTLRQLYSQINPGYGCIPAWVSIEYLRYHVLIHDIKI